MRAILTCSTAVMLAGCGGGGTMAELENQIREQYENAIEPNRNVTLNQATTVTSFGTNDELEVVNGVTQEQGVAQSALAEGVAAGRQTIVLMAHDMDEVRGTIDGSFAREFVTWVDANETFNSDDEFDDVVIVESKNRGQGLGDLGEIVGYIKMKDYDAYAAYLIEASGDLNVAVFGPEVAGLPSGEHTYRGRHIVAEPVIVGEIDNDGGLGHMQLVVDFDAGTGSLQTSNTINMVEREVTDANGNYLYGIPTPTGGLEVSGNIVIDVENGTFTGDSLTIAAGTEGIVYNGEEHDFSNNPWAVYDGKEASIHGNFHGTGGEIVTGLWHENTNGALPSIAGAIIGKVED